MRRCTTCDVEKPDEAFYIGRARCILCIRDDNRARYWRDPAPKRAAARAWWQAKGAAKRAAVERRRLR